MPHCIVEYSDNLAAEGEIPVLLERIAGEFKGAEELFPLPGIRVRAHRVLDYVIADGLGDYGFVHLHCRIVPGRNPDRITRHFEALFDLVKAHFAKLMTQKKIGLSMDIDVSAEGTSYKFQNILKVSR